LSEEGFIEAFARIAALPVTLPAPIRIAFRTLTAKEQLDVQRRFANHHAPPLMRLQWAALVADCGGGLLNCAVDVIEELASPAAEAAWELFETLLVWAWSWLGGDKEGEAAEAPSLLAGVWLHASRIHHLLSGGGEEARIAQSFVQDMPPLIGFGSHPAFGLDIASPRCAKRVSTLVWGVADVFSRADMQPQLVDRLQNSVGRLAFPEITAPHPNIDLLEQDSALPNALGSFLNRDAADALSKFLPGNQAEQLSARCMQELTDLYLGRVASDPSNPDLWLSLAILLRLNPPLASQRAALQDLLASFEFRALVEPSVTSLNWITAFFFGQAAYFPNAFTFDFWKQQLLDLSDFVAEPNSNNHFTFDESGELLNNSVLLLSNALPKNRPASMCSFAADICARHPQFGRKLLFHPARMLLREPPAQRGEAWKSITELRFLAS
jgi:hypothetical protein